MTTIVEAALERMLNLQPLRYKGPGGIVGVRKCLGYRTPAIFPCSHSDRWRNSSRRWRNHKDEVRLLGQLVADNPDWQTRFPCSRNEQLC